MLAGGARRSAAEGARKGAAAVGRDAGPAQDGTGGGRKRGRRAGRGGTWASRPGQAGGERVASGPKWRNEGMERNFLFLFINKFFQSHFQGKFEFNSNFSQS